MFYHDIANALAGNFSHNSSSAFSTDAFTFVRHRVEKQNPNFSSDNAEALLFGGVAGYSTYSPWYLAGPNEIHYQLLKHLPNSSQLLLLNIFNKIWISDNFLSDWRKAIVMPVPKTGKDLTNPTNYRPLSFTSCIYKTMEQIINLCLSGTSNPTICSLMCNVASDPDVAQLIILLDLKHFAGKLSSIINT